MKQIKFAGRWYTVHDTKSSLGITWYKIEDEPNHFDWISENSVEKCRLLPTKENTTMSKQMDIHGELDRFIEENEGQVTLADIAKHFADYGCQHTLGKVYAFLEKYAANFVALPDEGQQPIGDTNAIYGTKSLLHYLREEMKR